MNLKSMLIGNFSLYLPAEIVNMNQSCIIIVEILI